MKPAAKCFYSHVRQSLGGATDLDVLLICSCPLVMSSFTQMNAFSVLFRFPIVSAACFGVLRAANSIGEEPAGIKCHSKLAVEPHGYVRYIDEPMIYE